jgi:hypothetical protein
VHLVVLEEVHHLGSSLEVMILHHVIIFSNVLLTSWQDAPSCLANYDANRSKTSGGSGERSDSDSSLAVFAFPTRNLHNYVVLGLGLRVLMLPSPYSAMILLRPELSYYTQQQKQQYTQP